MARRRDGKPPLRRQDFGYRAGPAPGKAHPPTPPPPPAPPSEGEARAAIQQALRVLGPLTFPELRRALPRIGEAELARLLGSMRLRGEIELLGTGWDKPVAWHLAGTGDLGPAG